MTLKEKTWRTYLAKDFNEICKLVPHAGFVKKEAPYFMEALTNRASDVDLDGFRILVLVNEGDINEVYVITYSVSNELAGETFDADGCGVEEAIEGAPDLWKSHLVPHFLYEGNDN